jgi:hypothetical protein
VEAFDLGVLPAAAAPGTYGAFDRFLRLGSGGYKRLDDSSDWYDSQEWSFVDLRIGVLGARDACDRITAQALAHGGVIPELFAASDGSYAGAMPMVGFGAGAYALWLLDRGQTPRAIYAPPVPAERQKGCGCGGPVTGGAVLLALLFLRRRAVSP